MLPQRDGEAPLHRRLGRTIRRGRKGWPQLAASMIAEAGSKRHAHRRDQQGALPDGRRFGSQVDKEMTTFTGVVHRDNWTGSSPIVLPQLLDARLPRGGLPAPQGPAAQRAQAGPAHQQRGGAGQGAAAERRLRRHAVRPHGPRHGRRHRGDHARRREEVRRRELQRARTWWSASPATIPTTLMARLTTRPRRPRRRRGRDGPRAARRPSRATAPQGLEVEIVKKETRATAISIGHPIPVTRNARRLRGAERRARLARRAPRVDVAPLRPHPRDARPELRRLRVHRVLQSPRHVQFFPSPNIAPPRAALRDLDPSGRAGERADGACASRCTRRRS